MHAFAAVITLSGKAQHLSNIYYAGFPQNTIKYLNRVSICAKYMIIFVMSLKLFMSVPSAPRSTADNNVVSSA